LKTFKDTEGREWTIAITVDSIKRVKSLLDFDLLDLDNGKAIERLVGDPILLCDTIYVICKPQADQRGVSDQDFGRAMAGDVLDRAITALLEDYCDFFPQPKRQVLQKAFAKLREIERTVIAAADQKITDLTIDELIGRALGGNSSGVMPPSAISTPAA